LGQLEDSSTDSEEDVKHEWRLLNAIVENKFDKVKNVI
jgi:hypothetical protein